LPAKTAVLNNKAANISSSENLAFMRVTNCTYNIS